MPDLSASMTFDFVSQSVGQVLQSKESQLRGTIAALGPNPSTADLLLMQQGVQQWTMMTQIQSTLIKEVSDAMKGIIQKAA